jgi:CRP-like cAMP-binding protein
MVNAPDIKLPDAFTAYIEQQYYAQVTHQSKLEVVVQDPDFLKNPLKHVALFSDHGILHGRDIARKIVQVIQQIHGLLIPQRTSSRLEFMLGYGAMLAYLHDIGMKNFSAFGRAMHPEFAAQLVFTSEFDGWVELLWRENAGNVAWRLMNLAVQGALQQEPQLVFREMLSLSMGHSKSKVPIDVLNDVRVLRSTMQKCVKTELHLLYHQQQVTIAERKLAQQKNAATHGVENPDVSDRLTQQLDTAKTQLANVTASIDAAQQFNPDVERHYSHSDQFEQTAFSWLVSDLPEIQQLTLDVIDTIRALRCADALRQRGTTFTTSAGYQVFVSQDTANAIYALQSGDRARLFFLEGKDPISAGEANMANSNLDQDGNLRIAFTQGAFSSSEATQWAAFSAAIVIQDIQADVIGSFSRSVSEQERLQGTIKLEQEMQIFIEGVDDNPDFADLVCQELSQLNPDLAPRIQAVTSLQHADLKQVDRYLGGSQPNWGITEKLHLLDQLVKSGHKVDHIDLDRAFTETRLITLKAGEVLMDSGVLSGFVYISLNAGLKLISATNYQMLAVLPWVPIGDVEAIRNTVTQTRVVAEQMVELLVIPKQIYKRYWYAPYTVNEFTQLFANGQHQPQLPSKRTTTLEMDLRRITRRGRSLPLAVHLMKLFPETEQLEIFMSYLKNVQLSQGEILFCQGDRPEGLYFVELGQIALVETDQAPMQTIHTFESGDLIGGWEFYSKSEYQHGAIANRDSTLHHLSTSAMHELQEKFPQVANTFTQHLLVCLAGQLNQAKQEITLLRKERTETIERLASSSLS